METFGDRLKNCRIKKDLTQSELAGLMGKAKYFTILNWELGKSEPSILEIKLLAQVLDTTVGYLVAGENQYGLQNGYIAVAAEDAVKYEMMMRKELEEEVKRLKNDYQFSDKR
jgi:transcriptional regulator with XRE-family HTH domain